MIARKSHESKGAKLPEEWAQKVEKLLEKLYLEYCEKSGKTFKCFGEIFNDEIICGASYYHPKHLEMTPLTYLVSVDVKEKQGADGILDLLVDSMGAFFDEYFEAEDWNNYSPFWQKSEFKKQEVFVQITRENIILKIQADELLGEL